MEKLRKIPYLPGWIAAALLAGLAMAPTYAYVRLIPAVICVIVVLYLCLALLARKKRELARILRAILTGVVIIGVVVSVLTGGAIAITGAQDQDPQCDYIVVLGAKVRGDGPTASLWERIDRAYDYLTVHPQAIAIVTGGKGADEPISEAQCMYDCLILRGIAPDRIWMEEKATSTWENLKFSLDIIEEKTGTRPDSIGVISSEYHLFRTALQARDRGLEVQPIPAKTGGFHRWLHYFVREICGVWHYLILGGQYS